MANPVIQSAVPEPAIIAPGETSIITVVASDGDNRKVTVALTVTDAQGNTGSATVDVAISDPLTITATVDGEPLPEVEPGKFRYTAPT